MKKLLLLLAIILPWGVFAQTDNLQSISPNHANPGQTVNVTIAASGTHFTQGSSLTITFGFNQPTTVSSYTVTNDTLLNATITVPLNTNTGISDTVYVTDSIDGTLFLAGNPTGFMINSLNGATLVAISPDSGYSGYTVPITISGIHTHFTKGQNLAISIAFNAGSPTAVNSYTVTNDSSINASITIPANVPTGVLDNVYVTDSIDGNLTLANGFRAVINLFPPPVAAVTSLVAVNPNSANAGQTLTVAITGTLTHFTQGQNVMVSFGFNPPTPATSYTVTNDSLINATVTVPLNAISAFDSVYVNDSVDGNLALASAFQVINPNGPQGNPPSGAALVAVTPDSINAGQTVIVTITGTLTHFTPSNVTVVSYGFTPNNSMAVTSYTVTGDSSINATITLPPNATSGTYGVYVTDSTDGNLTLMSAFMVPGAPNGPPGNPPTGPALVAISPDSATVGQTVQVTISGTGTHFTQDNNLTVTFGTGGKQSALNAATIFTINNDSSITCSFPVSPIGSDSVYVSGSVDGNLTLPYVFKFIASPSIVSVNPDSVLSGYTLPVTITGSHTHFTKSNVTAVSFGFNANPTAATSYTVVSATSIIATIAVPVNLATGNYTVYVNDSVDGNLQLTNGLTVIKSTCRVSISYSNASPPSQSNPCIGYLEAGANGKSPFTYKWSDSSTVNLPDRYNVCAGTYSVIVTDSIGCVDTAQATVFSKSSQQNLTVNPYCIFIVSVTNNTDNCQSSITISETGGVKPYPTGSLSFVNQINSSIHSNGVVQSINDTTLRIDKLCFGVYTLSATDGSSSSEITVAVASEGDIYTNNTHKSVTTPPKDTLYAQAQVVCGNLNYANIDSIRIASYSFAYNIQTQQPRQDSIAVTWKVYQSGGSPVAVVENYPYKGAGTFAYSLQLYCVFRSSSIAVGYDELVVGSPDGIETLTEKDVTVYPNPFNNQLTVMVNTTSTVKISDIIGNVVYTGTANPGSSVIETSNLAAGVYLVTVTNAQGSITKKVIKD